MTAAKLQKLLTRSDDLIRDGNLSKATPIVLKACAVFQQLKRQAPIHRKDRVHLVHLLEKTLAHAEEWCDREQSVILLNTYAQFLYEDRQYRKASIVLGSLLKTPKEISDQMHVDAERLYGACLFRSRDYGEALKHYTRAMNRSIKLGPDAQKLRAQTLCDMARAQRLNQQRQYALQFLREASQVVSEPDGEIHARLLLEEAAIEYDAAQYRSAINLYRGAANQMESARLASSPEYVECLIGLAMSHFSLHEHDKVEPLLVSSIEILRRQLGPRSDECGKALHKLAGVYKHLGRFVESSVLLSGVEEIQGRADTLEGASDFEIGRRWQQDGEIGKALKRYQRTLSSLQDMDMGKSFEAMAVHIRLYEVYLNFDDELRSESHYRRAVESIEFVFGHQQPNAFSGAMVLARAFRIQDKDDIAESFYFFALELARRNSDPTAGRAAADEYATMLQLFGRPTEAKAVRARAKSLFKQPAKRPRKAVRA